MVHRRRRSTNDGTASRSSGSGPDPLKPKLARNFRERIAEYHAERAREEKRTAARAKNRNVKTKATCVVCGGIIMSRRRQPHRHFDWNTPIGPGGPPQPALHEGYHCRNCGLEYHKLPKLAPLESRLLDRAHAAVWGFRLGIITEEEAEDLIRAHAERKKR